MVADSSIHQIVVATLAVVTLGACSSSDGGSDDQTVHFTPLERQSTVTEPVSPPSPPISLEDRPSYRQIIDGFRKNAAELFERGDLGKRLEQVERVFLGTGKYLELVAIYQDVYDEQGIESPVAERLTWSYIRLGQLPQARELLDKLREVRPDDPKVAFLDGFYWMNTAQGAADQEANQKALARTAIRWRRTLELDPNFSDFGRVTARSLRAQVRNIEQRLSKPAEEIVGGQMAGGGGQKAEDGGQTTDDGGQKTEGGAQEAEDGEPRAESDEQAAESGERRADKEQSAAESGEQAAESGDRRAEKEASAAASAGSEDGPTPTGVLMMRADEALENGDVGTAMNRYQQILERQGDHVGARIGMLRARWKQNPEDASLAEDVRQLATSDALSARQAYDLSLFAKVRLKNSELAEKLRKRVREIDPEFAEKVGIGK